MKPFGVLRIGLKKNKKKNQKSFKLRHFTSLHLVSCTQFGRRASKKWPNLIFNFILRFFMHIYATHFTSVTPLLLHTTGGGGAIRMTSLLVIIAPPPVTLQRSV